MARKILLADDSVTAQNMGRKILADAGYDVVTVNNGSAALKRIAELKPDLVVLDVYMPGYSGLEVCQRLKDAPETAPIPVLLTVGKLEPFKAEEARRVRADAHIVKPFEASELLSAIARLEDRLVAQPSPASDASAETGWTSRLSFPSKKKKNAEPADTATAATFRDFRKGNGKTTVEATSAVETAPAVPPVQTAAVAQEPQFVPEIPDDVTPEELDALSAFAAKLDGLTPAARITAEKPMPVVEAAPVDPPAAAAAVNVPLEAEPEAFAVEGKNVEEQNFDQKNEFEIPTGSIEPEIGNVVVPVVDSAHLAEPPAPVDRNDEPMFASAVSEVEQPTEVMAGTPPSAKSEESAPSDSELAEALRLLTPATGQGEGSPVHLNATPVSALGWVAHDATNGPRWIAEPVALSAEEATISLEAEMFRTFTATPATTSSAGLESGPQLDVSAMATAIGNKLATALAAGTTGDATEGCTTIAADSKAATPVAGEPEAESTEQKALPVEANQPGPAEEPLAEAQETLKAMAAAAAAESSGSAKDSRSIANIVDSVLADLRPKLLEEIAKKMAEK